MARKRAFTKKRRQEFLEQLAKSGNVSSAAAKVGVSRQYMYELRDADPEFEADWDAAELQFLDAAASEEARRALVGDDRRRVSTRTREELDAQGRVVARYTETVEESVNVKSDRLLAHLLDRRHPDFAKAASRRELTGPDGAPIKIERVEFVVVDPPERDAAATAAPGGGSSSA